MIKNPHIDPSFRAVVEAHIVGNLAVIGTESPLILGIFGPPGEGKTFQVDQICNELELKCFVIGPGELESENAGQPGQLLRQQYLQASQHRGQRKGTVLLVNDIDAIIGKWGDLVQYTVNRQVVFSQLMALCDYPNEVAGQRCNRTPIIVTGNNPSVLYAPLLRPGRTRLFSWEPALEAKLRAISPMYPNLPPEQVRAVVAQLQHKPISFWSDVRAAIWERKVEGWLASQVRSDFRRLLTGTPSVNLSYDKSSIEELTQVALALGNERILDQSFVTV